MTTPTGTSPSSRARPARVWVLAGLAMVGFAANSVLNRLALDNGSIDAGSFTAVRLLTGAVVLLVLVRATSRASARAGTRAGSWGSAALLLLYAAAFSYAYVDLGAGTGALLLFGVVQLVIFSVAIRSGERPGLAGWSGLALALAGLVLLVGPGASPPDPVGAALMTVAGVAWAGYTLRGRGAARPLLATTGNFVRSVPLGVVLLGPVLLARPDLLHVSATGLWLAALSGGLASGVGYALWYAALPSLTRVQSGIIQLSPPPLAAVAGLLLMSEPLTGRVVLSSVLVLGGVLVGLLATAPRNGR